MLSQVCHARPLAGAPCLWHNRSHPMRLTTAHKILIASAAVFFVFFAIVLVRRFAAGNGYGYLAGGILAVVTAIAFVIYFRTIRPPR